MRPIALPTLTIDLTVENGAMLLLFAIADGKELVTHKGELYAVIKRGPPAEMVHHTAEQLDHLEDRKLILLQTDDRITVTATGQRELARWKVRHYGTSKVSLSEVNGHD